MEKMERRRLESYRSMKDEIQELNYALEHLGKGDSMVRSSTVFDYRSGYPVPQAVVGVDWDKVYRLENRYKKKIASLEVECCAVEEYIEGISDSITRRIFRMYYLEGKKQKEIGKIMHMDRSTVSKRLNTTAR